MTLKAMKKVSRAALHDGIKLLSLPASLKDKLNIVPRVIPMRIDPELMESGTSGPESAALFLPAFELPETLLWVVVNTIKGIEIFGSDKIDEMAQEGFVVPLEGHRDAFWDEDRQVIVIRPPEELTLSAHGALLHEFGHIFYLALDADEKEALEAAHYEEGQRASANPSTEDEEENFAEAFRVYYEGGKLPNILSRMMGMLDTRARASKDHRAFAEGRA